MTTSGKRHGFSLVELMVGLTAGTLVVGAVYVVGAGSGRYFQRQHRLAQVQMAARGGMDQLRRDIARAGLMSTPNSRVENLCMGPPRHLQAVEFLNNVDTDAIPNATENGVTADRLRLVGNYATADSYIAASLNAAGTQVRLQQSWQSFRRTFVNQVSGALDAQRFDEVFQPGRYLHIHTLQGQSFFVRITGTVAGNAAVNFTPSLPVGSICLAGLGDGATVSPIMRIEYLITDLGGALTSSQSTAVSGQPTQLVRREIGFDAGATPVVNTEQVVLEYAVDFNFRFVVDNALAGATPALATLDGLAAAPMLADVNANAGATPERLRSVHVSVSVRTLEQDAAFAFVTRDPTQPLKRFRFDAQRPGSARVRNLVAEVFLPNVGYWRSAL